MDAKLCRVLVHEGAIATQLLEMSGTLYLIRVVCDVPLGGLAVPPHAL